MKTAKEIRPYEILVTARWITLAEALVYSCIKSRNTFLKLINTGKIYGTKRDGEYIVDRESIDRYYNAERDEARIHLTKIRRAI